MKKYIGYGWGKLGVLVAMLAIAHPSARRIVGARCR